MMNTRFPSGTETGAGVARARRPRGVAARGVATLAVTLIMLALSALVVLYTNRGQLFEQRISANQLRATTAFETAEAGVEWGLARLMDTSAILANTACTPVALGTALSGNFSSFYVPLETPPAANPYARDFTPPNNSRAACAIDELSGALTCNCPTPGTAPTIATPGTRSFNVHFEDTADPATVRISSVGCVNNLNGANAALCGAFGSTPESSARVTVLAKFVAGSGQLPKSALTAGGYINECSATNIINTDPISGGFLMNSGANTVVGRNTYMSGPLPAGARNCGGGPAQTLTTIPGTPLSAAIFPNDGVLAAASQDSDSMMMQFLGMSRSDYINSACQVTSANEIITMSTRLNSPCNRFWSNADLSFTGNVTVGTDENPVLIATDRDMTISGGSTIHGIVYSDRLYWEHNGAGAGTVIGAMIVRGSYYGNANMTIEYRSQTLGDFTRTSGQFVRVPGSWKDFQ